MPLRSSTDQRLFRPAAFAFRQRALADAASLAFAAALIERLPFLPLPGGRPIRFGALVPLSRLFSSLVRDSIFSLISAALRSCDAVMFMAGSRPPPSHSVKFVNEILFTKPPFLILLY